MAFVGIELTILDAQATALHGGVQRPSHAVGARDEGIELRQFAVRQLPPPCRRRDVGAEAVEERADLGDAEPRLLSKPHGIESPNGVRCE